MTQRLARPASRAPGIQTTMMEMQVTKMPPSTKRRLQSQRIRMVLPTKSALICLRRATWKLASERPVLPYARVEALLTSTLRIWSLTVDLVTERR